jgi:hypothetical protein
MGGGSILDLRQYRSVARGSPVGNTDRNAGFSADTAIKIKEIQRLRETHIAGSNLNRSATYKSLI